MLFGSHSMQLQPKNTGEFSTEIEDKDFGPTRSRAHQRTPGPQYSSAQTPAGRHQRNLAHRARACMTGPIRDSCLGASDAVLSSRAPLRALCPATLH